MNAEYKRNMKIFLTILGISGIGERKKMFKGKVLRKLLTKLSI